MAKAQGIKVKVGYEVTAKTKPFYARSEFWGMLVVMIMGLLVTIYGTFKGNESMIAVGGIMTAVVQGAYTHSRGQEKKGLATAAAAAIMETMNLRPRGLAQAKAELSKE